MTLSDLAITESDTPFSGLPEVNRPVRPLLARVADATYWMARYMERAEQVARNLVVNIDLLTDVGDMAPQLRQRIWRSVLQLTDLDAPLPDSEGGADFDHAPLDLDRAIPEQMTFSPTNSNSILACLTQARENARSVRETISTEMWESLNTLYLEVKSEEMRGRFEEAPIEIYRLIMRGTLLFQGLTEQTISHGQLWSFAQLGRYMERIDMTCRILETRSQVLKEVEDTLEMPLRNIHWMAVLRACGALEGYRRMNGGGGEMEPLRIANFIIFEPTFPRTLRYAVRHAQQCVGRIGADAGIAMRGGGGQDQAARILGRLHAELEYSDAGLLVRQGLPAYLLAIRASAAEAALATQKAYFIT